MTKLWKNSKKIVFPLNNRVIVRITPGFPMDDTKLNRLNIAYNTAINRVKAVYTELKHFCDELEKAIDTSSAFDIKKHQSLINFMKRFFNADVTHDKNELMRIAMSVKFNLGCIYQGLLAELTPIHISDVSKRKRSTARGYVYSLDRPDTIYFDLGLLDKDDDIEDAARTLVHEASHLFAATEDFDTYYHSRELNRDLSINTILSKPLIRPSLNKKLTSQQKLKHADTYAYFVKETSEYIKETQANTKVNFREILSGREFIKTNYSCSNSKSIPSLSCSINLFAATKHRSNRKWGLSSLVETLVPATRILKNS